MRLLGAALLVGGCAGVGWRHKKAMVEAVRALEDMIAALDRLRSELMTNRTPLPALTEELARSGPGAVRCVFAAAAEGLRAPDGEGFAALWARSLRRCGALGGGAVTALEHLGAVLGRYGVDEQASAIDRCTAHLERELTAAREKLRREGVLAPALGTAAGLVGSVLLF